MKLKYQIPVLLVTAFFIRPLLAESIQQRDGFGEVVETESTPTTPEADAKGKDTEGTKAAKKGPKKDAGKVLRELFEKQLGHPVRKAL